MSSVFFPVTGKWIIFPSGPKRKHMGETVMPSPQLQGFKDSGEDQELDSIIH